MNLTSNQLLSTTAYEMRWNGDIKSGVSFAWLPAGLISSRPSLSHNPYSEISSFEYDSGRVTAQTRLIRF